MIECLAELVAEEGVVREPIPDAATGEPVVAMFLVPFHRAEISLAGQLRALARTDADRLPGFAARGLGPGVGLVAPPHRHRVGAASRKPRCGWR